MVAYAANFIPNITSPHPLPNLSSFTLKMSGDWSAVPFDILELISKRLISWDDYVRFRSVCTSWRSAATKRPQITLIFLRPTSIVSHSIKLFNFPNLELYDPPKLSPRVSREGERICGSSRGWICSIGTTMSFYNPFTGREIRLPNLPKPADPKNVVLSSDPGVQPRDCVVIANCWDLLMFRCRLGDASWTPVLYGFSKDNSDEIHDTIFYKNKSYAVSKRCRLLVCDFKTDGARFTEIPPADPLFPGSKPVYKGSLPRNYLVVSSGDLLLAQINFGKLSGCELFRVVLDDGLLRLFKLANLGGLALFLGPSSMSVSAAPSAADHRCRGNCIYLTGSNPIITVLNMEDSSISSVDDSSFSSYVDTCWPLLYCVWLTPSLC